MMAAMRGVKAEGGWGVVCTEYCSIHASSDESPYPSASLRDDDDVRNLCLMTDAVHAEGSLAGVELWYGGRSSANLYSREVALDVASLPNSAMLGIPVQSQAMSKADIQSFRKMHRDAARRAMEADFDIVYVYGNHDYLLHNFLNPYYNQREDEYGGSIGNRVRLLREVIEDVGEEVSGRCAVAVRYSMPMQLDDDAEGLIEAFEQIAELPDLWDITVRDYRYEMGSSRFVKEAANQAAVVKIKSMTSKPVVSVGRFTSPDTMLSQVVNGTQDFIGAARPSIADPFLPQKIDQGRIEDIRECIGCNVCYAHDSLGVPIRCTQNPTMGEEWRRGWHPDRIAPRHADESVLVVGSGPAGLEAACALGQRGYQVILAEAEQELGGRINRESRLPGLSEYARVRDWRVGQLATMENVQIYPDNRLGVESILELDCQHIILATGAGWRSDGVGRWSNAPFAGCELDTVVAVEQVLSGFMPDGHVIVYDDDHYYLGSAIALKLCSAGVKVSMVTPESSLADWSHHTEEHSLTMRALIEAGVEIATAKGLVAWQSGELQLECIYSGRESTIEADYLVPISARIPRDDLWRELDARRDEFDARGGLSLQRVGDCQAPGIIAAAVYAGHKAARELGCSEVEFKRDRVVV